MNNSLHKLLEVLTALTLLTGCCAALAEGAETIIHSYRKLLAGYDPAGKKIPIISAGKHELLIPSPGKSIFTEEPAGFSITTACYHFRMNRVKVSTDIFLFVVFKYDEFIFVVFSLTILSGSRILFPY